MSALDIVIAVILGVSTLYGLVRGFVHIAMGIAGFGLGLAAALRLADRGPTWFEGHIANPSSARLAAFCLVLVGALIVTALVIWIAGKLVRAAGIGWMDRLAGGIIGFAGGLLTILGVLLGLTTFLAPGSALLRSSHLLPVVMGGVDLAAIVLPPGLAHEYQERRQALAGRLGEAAPPPAAPKPALPAPKTHPAPTKGTT